MRRIKSFPLIPDHSYQNEVGRVRKITHVSDKFVRYVVMDAGPEHKLHSGRDREGTARTVTVESFRNWAEKEIIES